MERGSRQRGTVVAVVVVSGSEQNPKASQLAFCEWLRIEGFRGEKQLYSYVCHLQTSNNWNIISGGLHTDTAKRLVCGRTGTGSVKLHGSYSC